MQNVNRALQYIKNHFQKLFKPLRHHKSCMPEEKLDDDEILYEDDEEDCFQDEENHSIIRAKWSIDGAKTLEECAAKLRSFADDLEAMSKEGWKLGHPVDDDYGFIHKNCPNHEDSQ